MSDSVVFMRVIHYNLGSHEVTPQSLRFFQTKIAGSGYDLRDSDSHLQCIFLAAIHDLQYQSSNDIESLAITHRFIPPGVREQNSFQNGTFFGRLELTKPRTSRAVKILDKREIEHFIFFR
jgi:hypothetical protein